MVHLVRKERTLYYNRRHIKEKMKEKNKRIFLHMNLEKNQTAGHKAVADCEMIMQKMGYERLDIVQSQINNKLIKNAYNIMQFLKLLFVKKGTEIVIEHPLYIHYAYIMCLKYVKKIKNIKYIFIIHDLEVLRGVLKSKSTIKKDEIMFEIADVMIVHNEKMKNYLLEEQKVSEDRLVTLKLFDYLTGTGDNFKKKEEEVSVKQITIAGNLSKEKSFYIYKLDKLALSDLKINLYGINFDKNADVKNCVYKGSYDADILPDIMEGDYGLVWDGAEITACAGNTGNYMRYNNPHKVSLYIAAELPIIIWKQAALADFVVENQIGFTVETLETIEDEIANISEEQYALFKQNLKKLSKKVRSGGYLRNALQSISEL